MKIRVRSILVISLMITLFSTSVLAAGEKSLVRDTDDMMRDYGDGFKITSEDKELVEAIRKTGKTDFKEGLYANFRSWSDFGPMSSGQYVTINNIGEYNKLIFDISGITKDKFGDFESFMFWKFFSEDGKMEGMYAKDYYNYDDYKNDYTYSETEEAEFSVEKIINNEEREYKSASVNVTISDDDWENYYSITPSNEWKTVEIDISDFDNLPLNFSISGNSGALISNPRLVKDKSIELAKEILEPKAIPSSSTVNVNGVEVVFDAYNINDNNYFKLRDLAKVVSGTKKQFEVKWDNAKKAIDLISNDTYSEVGGELVAGDGITKNAITNTSKIYMDGKEIELESYTINNSNYFKLRDIAKEFNIGVGWDGETKTVTIDTSIDYVE